MNDKILKLAAKSGLYVESGEIYQNNDDYYALSFPLTEYMDKFAELIVRECANVAAEHDALDIYEEIREHFGVEG